MQLPFIIGLKSHILRFLTSGVTYFVLGAFGTKNSTIVASICHILTVVILECQPLTFLASGWHVLFHIFSRDCRDAVTLYYWYSKAIFSGSGVYYFGLVAFGTNISTIVTSICHILRMEFLGCQPLTFLASGCQVLCHTLSRGLWRQIVV